MRGSSYAYQAAILAGAHDEAAARGVDLYAFIGGPAASGGPTAAIYGLPGPGDLDGAIVATGTFGGAEQSATVLELLHRFDPDPVCSIGYPYQDVVSVSIENSSGLRTLTSHLIERHGKRRIAFISGPGDEAERRLEGYREALWAHGLECDPDLLVPGDFTRPSGAAAAERLATGPHGLACDAVVAANDLMALGALQAFERLGIRVPEDVALIGFDDMDEARFAMPPLTTVRQPIRRLASEAVRLVTVALDGKRPESLVLETVPQVRQSCGCFGRARAGTMLAHKADISGLQALALREQELARAVAATAPDLDQSVGAAWSLQMVAALARDLREETDEHLAMFVHSLVAQTAHLGNVSAWHHVITALRDQTAPLFSAMPRLWWRAEAIFGQVHVLIGQHAERIQGARRLEKESLMRSLEAVQGDVRMTLDATGLGGALLAHLPSLSVPSAYVLLGAQTITPGDEARLVVACDAEAGSLIEGEETFRAGQIVPGGLAPARRHTMLVYPLFFRSETLGFCAFEMGPRDGSVYEGLRDQVSTAVKASELFRAGLAEATARERAEKARLEGDMELARRIQTGILPRQLRVAGLEVAAAMLPATEVGGDYFDVLPFAGGCWLGIGDVAGHGLDAGLMMLMIQSIIAATTHRQPAARPSEVWLTLNAVLYENVRVRLQRTEHATLSILRYEENGRVVFAGGHEDLIVYRAALGRCEMVETPGPWAAVRRDGVDEIVTDLECSLQPGDVMLLYTDGIVESRNAAREQFGVARLREALESVADRPVQEMCGRILATVLESCAAQDDDITLLVARYTGPRT